MNNCISWVGSAQTFIDEPSVVQYKHINLGRLGGNSKTGQNKNEDGCLIWWSLEQNWEFIMLLDAHSSDDSAKLITHYIMEARFDFLRILELPVQQSFQLIKEKLLHIFNSNTFLTDCKNIKGESSCLIVLRKEKYIWWFSVGDCLLYYFHPDLIRLGQFQLNQRQFFEWIGQMNTFNQEVPCYSTGVRELRKGENHIFLCTDGLIECPHAPFAHPERIFNLFSESAQQDTEIILSMLETLQSKEVKDSTTIISWKVLNSKNASMPSDELN